MNKRFKKVMGPALSAALALACVFPVCAASSADSNNPTDIINDLNNHDIIDMSQKGRMHIYKYDMTAAAMGGVDFNGLAKANGKSNQTVEQTMFDYAVEGVEFSYLKVAKIETYTKNGVVKVVYGLPHELALDLGLRETDAFNPADIDGGCSDTGVWHFTSQQINDGLKAILEADDEAAKDALEKYIQKTPGTVKMPLTSQKGYTTASDLELGLYLLVETKVPENITETVNPWFVQLPTTTDNGEEWFYDVTLYPKNQSGNPTLDKLVRNASGSAASTNTDVYGTEFLVSNYLTGNDPSKTESIADYMANRKEYTFSDTGTASEGDILDYLLVSKLPHASSQATYLTEYKFEDILSEGITYNEDVQIAIYQSYKDIFDADMENMANNHTPGDSWDPVTDGVDGSNTRNNFTDRALAVWNINSTAHHSEYADVTVNLNRTGETKMTVTLTEAGLKEINTKYPDYYLVVYYSGTMKSNAKVVLGDDGNENDVTLTWRRTSSTFYNTLEDECIIYAYGINLQKDFSDDLGDATKVQFVLYNDTDGYYVQANEEGTNEAGKKVYYVTGKCINETNATVFSPDVNGALLIQGLEGDHYTMTEIQTDEGYSLLKAPLEIEIHEASRDIQAGIAGWTGLKGYNNGQENGGIDMYIGALQAASAKVNAVEASLSNCTVTDGSRIGAVDSAHGLVDIHVLNSKGFLLPQTGGSGLYLVTILGVVAVAGGCYFVFRRKKNGLL